KNGCDFAARWDPDRTEGFDQRRRPAMHLRLENSWRLSRTLYCNRDRKVARTWCDSIRTNEHGRVRDGILDGKFEPAADAQSMGLVASARWIKRRLSRRRGRRHRFWCTRYRHRRVDSSARGAVRSSRLQTELRPRFAFRSCCFRFLPRPDRAANEKCTRLRVAHECDCRPRPAGFDFARRASAGLHKESWSRSQKCPHWITERIHD